MHPTVSSGAHLADRAIEIRALKAAVAVFLVALGALFFSLTVAVGVFAIAYVAYKYTYYAERIDVFATDDLAVRHNRLELALLAVVGTTLGAVFAIEVLFPLDWTLGGFLSLPPMDLTDPGGLLEDPAVPLGWVIVLAPVVAASYAGFQFRHRLLFGLDSDDAAIRATVWESFARLPVYLAWVGIITTRPIYDVWRPVVQLGAELVGLTAGTTGGFAVLLGSSFSLVVLGGLAAAVAVIAVYIGIQRWKYDDATIPEVFGHPGLAPPSQHLHEANVAVPVAVFLLYTVGMLVALDSLPITDLRVALAVVISVVVGADYLGRTTLFIHSVSERAEETVDAVVTGFVVGLFALVVLSVLVGPSGSFATLALTYPIVALPLTHLGHRLAGRYAVDDITRFVSRIEADPDEVDEAAADRLFVYSESTDETRRARAIDGLSSLIAASIYRRDDAIVEFIEAVDSDHEPTVQAGLHGIATVLEHDRTVETYEGLVDAGTTAAVVAQLDSEDAATQARATEAAARLFSRGLAAAPSDIAAHLPSADRVALMEAAVDRYPEDQALAGAVVEFFARLWYAVTRADGEAVGSTDDAQHLLGGLLRLSDRADDEARLMAVVAVTSDRAAADVERFTLAVDRLDSASEAVRYLAVHVIRSSIDRHETRVDLPKLVERLEDPAEEVQEASARTIATFVPFAPDRAAAILDRLVLHLEEHVADPGPTEGHLVRALAEMGVDDLIDHPTAAPAVADYVDGTSPSIAEPAARVLSSIVAQSPTAARDETVGAAIEAGLTSPSSAARAACLDAVVAIVDDSVEGGRRFVDELTENLSAEGTRGALAAVCLAELLRAVPEDGVAILPALAPGLRNLTPVDPQAVPFVVGGNTVSEVTVDILEKVLPLAPDAGEVLIDPLTDVATTADGAALEGILKLLAVLSAKFPTECRAAVNPAAAVIENDRMGVRLAAARLLANVAARHPAAVEPFIDRLVVATDDDYQRVRAAALVALTNVCVTAPAAIEPDIHRVIGLLDDDSAYVREHAAHLIIVVAEREPAIVEPAAETADRLRRLQRDPAVDIDVERLQDASTAIQTGTPIEEVRETDRDGEPIWSPESAGEMGASGDTKVFVPGGDEFDEGFAAGLDEESESSAAIESDDEPVATAGSDSTASGEPTGDVEGKKTRVDPAGDEAEDIENIETEIESDDGTAEVGGLETAIGEPATEEDETGSEETNGDDIKDLDTVIEPAGDGPDEDTKEEPDDVEAMDTVIESDEGELSERDTPDDVEALDTVIERAGDSSKAGEADDLDELETVIEAGGDTSDDEIVDAEGADDVEDLETVIAPGDDASEGGRSADVEDLETVIEPADDGTESDDPDDGD